MRLDPAAAAAGFRHLCHETVASTNAEALALASKQGDDASAVWITAREQTAGRGRRGNAWNSSAGNLFATLLLIDPAPPHRAPELSFVAALAVSDAIQHCAPGLRATIALKWPNDVLCAGAKLAGILIEGQAVDAKLAVAIGIGVNCVHHPLETPFPATDLAALGAEVSAADLFEALTGTMLRRLQEWRHGEGFAALRADWLERSIGTAGAMRVRLPGRELHGRCEGLDDSGRLLLRLADGSLETIAAGEVFPVSGGDRSRLLAGADGGPNGAD
jgi:BirA family biotin operon repressor/biotin-[acetyl-CoA-carboxylase] ligase